MHFKDLKFSPREYVGGIGARAFFDNGYGASIIQGEGTYGGPSGLYEIAVLKGNEDSYELDYSTNIPDEILGVIGWLNESEVEKKLEEINNLSNEKDTVK